MDTLRQKIELQRDARQTVFTKIVRTGGAAFALSGLLLSNSAFAQVPGPASQNKMTTNTEDFRRTAPQPLAARTLNLPTPVETTLSNGLRVVMLENKNLPLVSFRLAFRTGSASDPRDIPGLTDMVGGLLTEGTQTRTSQQISEQVARLGATLTADASADSIVVAASALKNYTDQILDLMADVTLRPSFPESEIALAKQNTKQGLTLQRSQAAFLAGERFSKVVYGDNPYAVVSTTPEAVDRMTRENLLAHYRQTFVPNNAVLIIAGDFDGNEMKRKIENTFGEAKWKRGTPLSVNFPAPPVRNVKAIYVVDRPGSQQSNIVIGNVALKRNNPDYFPVLVMNTVLGANASSRLFMNLREAKGYTYGAYSNTDTRREAGTFRASAEVRTPVTGDSLKEFFYELNRIRTDVVGDKELTDAKAYLTGVFPIRLETQEGIVGQLLQIKLYDLPANYLQTYRDEINKVTAKDVQRVAQKYLTPDQAAIVIVGDYAKIIDQIKPYAAAVEVYDSNGNRKDTSAVQTPTTQTSSSTTTMNNQNANAQQNTGAQTSGLYGKWTLSINSPQGTLPATLNLSNDGKGSIEVPQLGTIELTDIKINGNQMTANATVNLQGQEVNATVAGRADGDKLNGDVSLTVPGAPPFAFTGTRAK